MTEDQDGAGTRFLKLLAEQGYDKLQKSWCNKVQYGLSSFFENAYEMAEDIFGHVVVQCHTSLENNSNQDRMHTQEDALKYLRRALANALINVTAKRRNESPMRNPDEGLNPLVQPMQESFTRLVARMNTVKEQWKVLGRLDAPGCVFNHLQNDTVAQQEEDDEQTERLRVVLSGLDWLDSTFSFRHAGILKLTYFGRLNNSTVEETLGVKSHVRRALEDEAELALRLWLTESVVRSGIDMGHVPQEDELARWVWHAAGQSAMVVAFKVARARALHPLRYMRVVQDELGLKRSKLIQLLQAANVVARARYGASIDELLSSSSG